MSKGGKDLLWSLFCALFCICIYGYSFNCNDQEEHLPQVYKLLNPDLYKGDYFVETASENFTIRYFYVQTVYAFSLLFGVKYSVLILFIASLTLAFYFIKRLTAFFFQNEPTSNIVTLLGPLFFNSFTTGGNSIFDTQLISSSFALPLCIGGIYHLLNRRIILAGIFTGLAACFQVLMGIHVFLILLMVLVWENNKNQYRNLFIFSIAFLALASPMLIPVLINQFTYSKSHGNTFNEALFFFRNPHHYIPSQFATIDYLKTAALLTCTIIVSYLTDFSHKKFLLRFNIICACFLVVYFFLFEAMAFYSFGKIQAFKITVWMALINGVALTGMLLKKGIEGLNAIGDSSKWFLITNAGILLMTLFLFTGKNYFPDRVANRYMIGNYKHNDLTKAHEWLKNNTSINSIVMSFPNDNSILCEAQRPVHIAYKAIIHEPYFLNEWMSKFKLAYQIKDTFTINHVFNLSSIDTFNYVHTLTQPHVDYFLTEHKKMTATEGYTIVYTNNSYAILENKKKRSAHKEN